MALVTKQKAQKVKTACPVMLTVTLFRKTTFNLSAVRKARGLSDFRRRDVGLKSRQISSARVDKMTSEQSPVVNIADMRVPYNDGKKGFDECDLVSKEPIGQFRAWFDEACKSEKIAEPNAMAIATADKSGRPSVRMVLLKGVDENGFKLFTNYGSHKGRDLSDNPYCSLLFYWEALKRQVRVEGPVVRLTEQESTEYFHRRPRASQIGAAISKQSTPIASRQVLEEKFAQMEKEYSDETKIIPKPDIWGGYLVKPEVVEFWEGQTNRVHDRIVFRRQKQGDVIDSQITKTGTDGWVYERLCP